MAEYLKIPEVARRLDVSEKTVRRYIKSGALPSTFIGGAYRVTEEDLEEYIHRSEVKPEAPKAESRSSREPSLFNDLEEERRLHYLKPWVDYINTLANRVEHEIDQGHVVDLNWWQEFTRDVLALTFLYNRILPPSNEQTENERLELLRLSEAIDRLNEVADKMDRAMEPVITAMHEEAYAKEREKRKAALKVFHGRRSA